MTRARRSAAVADRSTRPRVSRRSTALVIDPLVSAARRPTSPTSIGPPWSRASRGGCCFAAQRDLPRWCSGIALVCPLHEWRFNLVTGQTENGLCPIGVYQLKLETDGTMIVELP